MSFIHKIVQKLLGSKKFKGRDFLIEKLPQWFLPHPKGKLIVKTNFGFKIQIDPTFDKNIENIIYQRGVYELGTLSVLQSFLKQGDVFVDVGANIGFLSLAGAYKVGKTGKVYAFEPVPETFEILKFNKSINEFNQIQLYQLALGNEEKEGIIYSESENRGGASIINHTSQKGMAIKVKRFDDLNISEKISVIKIDVEGFEFEVLKGAKNTIKRHKPSLIIEYSKMRINSAKDLEIFNWLKALNIYKIYKLKSGKERPSELVEITLPKDLPEHDNIFCISEKVFTKF